MDPALPPAPGSPARDPAPRTLTGAEPVDGSQPVEGSAAPAAGPGRKRAAQLSTGVGLLIGGVTCAFVVRTLSSEWSEVREAVLDASPGWVAVCFGLCILGMTSIGWVWTDVLGLVGAHVQRARAMGWYYIGELGKYLPGGVWPVLGRGELARRNGGVPGPRAYASVALSLVALYLAAMMAAIGLLPFALGDEGPGAAATVLVLLPLGLALLHPRVLEPALGMVRRLTKRPLAMDVPAWRDTVSVVVRYIPTWAFIGGATAAMAQAIDPSASPTRIVFAAVLSWVAGFLAVPVPAGAGVREAVFIAASGLPPELGATVAVATRVLFIVVDCGGAAIAVPLLRRTRGTTLVAEGSDR